MKIAQILRGRLALVVSLVKRRAQTRKVILLHPKALVVGAGERVDQIPGLLARLLAIGPDRRIAPLAVDRLHRLPPVGRVSRRRPRGNRPLKNVAVISSLLKL